MAFLGDELRRERQRKGLTFEDIEQALHIRAAYLEAIEDGNFDVIPGHVYVKGFIRNYGNFLGLDGQRLVLAYKDIIGEDRAFVVRTALSRRKKEHKALVQNETDQIKGQRFSFESRNRRREKTLAQERMIVGIVILAAILFFAWLFFV